MLFETIQPEKLETPDLNMEPLIVIIHLFTFKIVGCLKIYKINLSTELFFLRKEVHSDVF